MTMILFVLPYQIRQVEEHSLKYMTYIYLYIYIHIYIYTYVYAKSLVNLNSFNSST